MKKAMKKAQLKIAQTAFMILALTFLFVMAFFAWVNLQMKEISAMAERIEEEKIQNMLERITEMPEIGCGHSCIDVEKIFAMKKFEYDWPFPIKIKKIYPRAEENECTKLTWPNCSYFNIYEKEKENYTIYKNYVALCSLQYEEGYTWQECHMGEIQIKKIKK